MAIATAPRVPRTGFRQLSTYPPGTLRATYLGIVVLATISLYYELYVQGAVATQILASFDMSLRYFIFVSVIGNLVGALASLAAGLADRWGRSNIVVGGLLLTGLLVTFGLPNAPNKETYLALFALVSLVEGAALVATPALIRDFSPQLGRASAMGFWTLGPVIGSLVVTEVSSHTLAAHPDWRFQFRLCGVVGLVVFALALVALRELSPQLRDQLMVSTRDKELIEARAAGIDPDAARQDGWRQMMHLDVVGSALAISLFLAFYYVLVGFFVVYFATTYGYSEERANSLANWYWIGNAVALVVAGPVSDLVRVRKPFMVVGAALSALGVALFAVKTQDTGTSYHTFALILLLSAVGGGIAYSAWMASFTETVERHNPAATATGLAVWGGLLRTVVTVLLIGIALTMTAANTLVNHGTRVQAIATKYAQPLSVLAKIDPATSEELAANPRDVSAQTSAVADIAGVSQADVQRASGLSTTYATQIATLQAIDPATQQALSTNPLDAKAGAKAVREIASTFGISTKAAGDRLFDAAALSKDDLAFLQTTGTKVQTAAAALTKASAAVPKADLAYVSTYGDAVQSASAHNRGQWQKFWWFAFGCQVLFVPFVFVMAGRWSPRRAKEDAERHAELVAGELARLRTA